MMMMMMKMMMRMMMIICSWLVSESRPCGLKGQLDD